MLTKWIKPLLPIVLGIFILFWGIYYYSQNKKEKATAQAPNVIIISVDTLAAGHIGAYGYNRDTTPNIDKFAKENTLFSNFFTPIPATIPSYASLFTGLYPQNHQTYADKLKADKPTLAEAFQKENYKTAAFVSSTIMGEQYSGLDRGFDYYNGVNNEDLLQDKKNTYPLGGQGDLVLRAERTSNEAKDWITTNKNDKFLLFVHYFDPHNPYDPRGSFDGKFSSSLPSNALEDPIYQERAVLGSAKVSNEDTEYLKAKYDEEIAYTDYYIGQLLDHIKSLGLNENSIIIITADHGESFGHNYLLHAYRAYDSTIKIPLIYHDPKIPGAKRIEAVASIIDIMPTLLSRIGAEIKIKMDGVDLSALINGGNISRKNIYALSYPFQDTLEVAKKVNYRGQYLANIQETKRLIYNLNDSVKELYNTESDPAQIKNIFFEDIIGTELFEDLIVWFDSNNPERIKRNLPKNIEIYEQLKSLGYL